MTEPGLGARLEPETRLGPEAEPLETIFAPASGAGVAGIAVIRLSGPAADAVLARLIPTGASFRELREVGPLLEPEAGSLLAYARAITYWHARHRHCGDCGSPTLVSEGGHLRVCAEPGCGQKHFPRTDPAIIVLVSDADECLLGRQAAWPVGVYSTIAGFVEPGESLESAVAREVDGK